MASSKQKKKQPASQKQQNAVIARWKAVIADGKARANLYLSRRPHRAFRITPTRSYKRGERVEGAWSLVKGSFGTIWHEKRTIWVLMLLFALTSYIVVGGISQLSFVDLRQATQELFQGNLGALGSVATLFGAAVTGSLSPTVSQVQQFLSGALAFLFWLSLIWILRRRLADQDTSVKEALYNSGAPVIPSILVATALMIQLIPAVIGILGAVLTLSGAWFQGGVESMLVCTAAALLVLLSIYWIAGSATAMIIVTIPGMYPWRALSAASDLVIGQRWLIALRVVIMALVVFAVWALVLVPILLLDGWLKFNWLPLIPIAVQFLGAFTLTYAATFVYKMYRSMI
ncbi:MAG TPA: hypothetical protein VJM32_02150 [Candidatus Saccharimonadales bacterium]|nr:hypothetical protein [Candidatus Saccharimonadales bacterium]